MKAVIRILFLFNPYIIINRVLNSVLIYLFTCLPILLFSAAKLVKNNELRGGWLLIKLNYHTILIVSSIYKYVWLKKWYVEFAIEMFLIMLFCAGYAIYNSWLFIVSEQIKPPCMWWYKRAFFSDESVWLHTAGYPERGGNSGEGWYYNLNDSLPCFLLHRQFF